MNKTFLLLILAFTASLPATRAQNAPSNSPVPPNIPAMISKLMGATDFIDGEVLKVYSAEDQGAKYLAYAVKYKGSDVVVPDLMHIASPKQPGDKITFIAQHMDLPSVAGGTNQVLQFTVMK